MPLCMVISRVNKDRECNASFGTGGRGQIEASERARVGPQHDREFARGRRLKHEFQALRSGAASQRTRLHVGDLEIVCEWWAQRQTGFIAIGDKNSRVETRQRRDALETFVGSDSPPSITVLLLSGPGANHPVSGIRRMTASTIHVARSHAQNAFWSRMLSGMG